METTVVFQIMAVVFGAGMFFGFVLMFLMVRYAEPGDDGEQITHKQWKEKKSNKSNFSIGKIRDFRQN